MNKYAGVVRGWGLGFALISMGMPAHAAWIAASESSAQIVKAVETSYDDYGNPTRVLVSQQVRRADGVVESMTTLNENTYYAPNVATWRIGQLYTAKVTHTQGNSVIVKNSMAVYDNATGALAAQISEPDDPEFRTVTRYERDNWGNVTLTGVRADYSAEPARRVAEVISTTTYDSTLHLFPVSESNALGHSVNRTYDLANGYLLSETGPNGLTTRYQYDIAGRVVASLSANGNKSLTTYASCTGSSDCPAQAVFLVKTQVVQDPDNTLPASGALDLAGSPIGPESYSYFDALRRDIYSRVQSLDGRWVISGRKELNNLGQVTRSAEPYFQGETNLKWTAFTYDVYGRLVKTVHPAGTTTTVAYGPLRTIYTNELGQKKSEEIGLQGKPVKITEAEGTTEEVSTLYTYDAQGRLLTITDAAGKLRRYTYDLTGNKLTDQDPNQGTWSYQYDGLGRLIGQTDAKGQATRMAYDQLGRLIERQAPDFNSQWIYDSAPKGIGKLAQVAASNGYRRTHSYDNLGRPASVITRIDNQDYQMSTAYDSFGRIQSLTYPTGFSYRNEYSARGFLTKVKSSDGRRTYWQLNDSAAATSDAYGRILQATLGNGVTLKRSYDPLTGQISSLSAGSNAAANNVQNEGYLFNDAGNLQSRNDYLSNLTENFKYDGLNRLSSATVAGQMARTVIYDKVGNITFKSDVGHYRYHANRPQAVAEVCRSSYALDGSCAQPYATYQYDSNGNITRGGQRDYTWTAFNKPLSVSRNGKTEQFMYDADYERVVHIHTDGAVTLYINPRLDSGAHFEVKKKGNSTEYTHHVYAGGEAVAAIVTLDTGNELGSVTQDFSKGIDGLSMAESRPDTEALFGWDEAGGRAYILTKKTQTSSSPMIKSNLNTPAESGVRVSVEVTLSPSADGERYLSIGLGNTAGEARGLWATFQGGDVYAVAQTKPLSSAESTRVLSSRLGAVVENVTYVVEVQAHTSGSVLFIYPKGQRREAGYRFKTQIPQLGNVQLGISGRSGSGYGNSISYIDNLVLAAGGMKVGLDAPYERYLHKDHLGSIVAVTDNQGSLLERFSYDAWGKRRNLDGTDDQSFDQLGQGLLPSLSTHHGFTGHEMLDDMSLVHMNGRIYDPIIARFVSADPFIDTLYSTQGLNSYSYVLNNPLNASDPDGYFSLKKAFKRVSRPVTKGFKSASKSITTGFKSASKSITKGFKFVVKLHIDVVKGISGYTFLKNHPQYAGAAFGIGCTAVSSPAGYGACVGVANAAFARTQGASIGDSLRIGAINGAVAGASAGVAQGIGDLTTTPVKGGFTQSVGQSAAAIGLHGLRGGVASVALGGDFRTGFVGGAFGAFGGAIGLSDGPVGAALMGGIGANITGGRFADGALQAVVGYVFNDMMHPTEERTWGSYLPGTAAGDSAAQYWADELVASGGGFLDNPLAAVGLGLSVLWTPDTAVETFATFATFGTGSTLVRVTNFGLSYDRPHKGMGPHLHYGPKYPNSNHPKYHFGPKNPSHGRSNFSWRDWNKSGKPWRWK